MVLKRAVSVKNGLKTLLSFTCIVGFLPRWVWTLLSGYGEQVVLKPGKRDCEQQSVSRVPGQARHLSLVLTLCDPVRADVSKFLTFATLCFHHYF